MCSIKDRVLQLANRKGVAKKTFCENIGMNYSNFTGKAAKTALNSDAIAKILSIYPDINERWLLTGEGEMLKNEAPPVRSFPKDEQESISMAIQTNNPQEGIPLIPYEAMAGIFTGDLQVMDYECERFVIPSFKGADFLIPVKGDSMMPKYNPGDIVAAKKLPLDTFFQWNKVYIIDTLQGPLIKRIKKSQEEDHLLIVSENPAYEPFDLHKSEVRGVAIVIGVVRVE